jgi:glycosyltransferase involved in cell wall biosynthesis
MNKMKILYLYSELVGYQISILKEYVEKYNADVHVMSWDKKKIKPYIPEAIDGVSYYKRSEYTREQILSLAFRINPDIIYISGWMDKDYLYVTKRMKKRKVPIVTAFDDVWKGTLRQKLGAFVFPFYFRKFFTHAWVAGPYQFEFAKKMGFSNNEIIFDTLSADTNGFKTELNTAGSVSEFNSFLYVGNFRKVKGVDILAEAFEIYRNKYGGSWSLICVGNGELEYLLSDNPNIHLYPYSSSEEIVKISKGASVFILPSRQDQWGVVVHEFCCLGMPLLLSQNIGARASFFINGFNGLEFKLNSSIQLAEQMLKFENMDKNLLVQMGNNSLLLSKKISVQTAAANFISVLKE